VSYPLWNYYPRNARPPSWVDALVGAICAAEETISTVEEGRGLKSDDVLKHLRPEMERLGYVVESGKSKDAKIFRPVLFGQNGVPEVQYEIDAFHDEFGIAVEVEAGRGAANNADYRDIVRTSLILDANYLVLLMPITYRSTTSIHAFDRTRRQLEAIYISNRLKLPFLGVLLIGY